MTHVEDILEHQGVKGMKWGVRRSGGARSSGSKSISEDAAQAKVHTQTVKKSSTDALSNKDLQALVTRMNLEKQFKTLQPPSRTKAVTKFTADVLLNVGKQQISKVVNDQVGKHVGELIKKAAA